MCLLFAVWINRQLEKADYAPTLFMVWTPQFPPNQPVSQTLVGRTEQHPCPGLIVLDDATGAPGNCLQ